MCEYPVRQWCNYLLRFPSASTRLDHTVGRHGAMQLETSTKCVSYARDADVRAARRSRAPMNSSERETQPNSAWITRSDAS